MNTTFFVQFNVLARLLARDWYIFKQAYLHRLKMALYWILLITFTTKMFMPAMGLNNFGPFVLISSAISCGFFIAMQNAIAFTEDITGNQAILYELTLPIAQWIIFLKFAISTIIQSFLISISIVPCGMLILMDLHPFTHFSWFKFIIIFICASIFYGTFSLIFTANLKNMQQIDNVWLRIIFPMWYLGCWQFPWATLYNISPTLAYLDLLNPITYIMEAVRNATINAHESLPFNLCCIMILLYAFIAGYIGIYWMKKRLDCL